MLKLLSAPSRRHLSRAEYCCPVARRARRRVLIRTESGGGTHDFLTWVSSPARRLHYFVGMAVTDDIAKAILALPERIWEPAYDAGG